MKDFGLALVVACCSVGDKEEPEAASVVFWPLLTSSLYAVIDEEEPEAALRVFFGLA